MKQFLCEDFLLHNDITRRLYHAYAAQSGSTIEERSFGVTIFWSRGYFVDTVGLNKRVGESGVTGENQLTEATFLEGGLLLITVHNTPQQPGKPQYHAEQNKQQQHPGDRDFQQGT